MENSDKIMRLRAKVLKAVDNIFSSRNIAPLVNDMAKDIKKRTRLGYGVSSFGEEKYKLPPLEERTVERREDLKQKGRLSESTSPAKSNLTERGFLLDALIGRFNTKGKINFVFRENRGDGKANSKIASYVSKKRPFLNISNLELKRFINQFKLKLTSEIAKLFKEG